MDSAQVRWTAILNPFQGSSMLSSFGCRADSFSWRVLLAFLADLMVLKRFGIESPSHCFSLFLVLWSKVDVHNRSHKTVICLAIIGSSHDSHDMDIHSVTGSSNNIVQEVSVLKVMVPPSGLVFVSV